MTPAQRSIEPDRVSPTVNGYFRIPAVWIGSKPAVDRSAAARLTAAQHETVFERKLNCGLQLRVQRDGHFIFDFSDWKRASHVVLPGYDIGPGDTIPKAHIDAEKKASQEMEFRAKVMNVHQACLTTGEAKVKRRGAMTGYPVTSREMHHSINFYDPPTYGYSHEYPSQLTKDVLNGFIPTSREFPRRILELDVVEFSSQLLDEILSRDEYVDLVDIIEALYVATVRCGETRLGEGLTVAWAASEQVISLAYRRLLNDQKTKNARVWTGERRDKLQSRDYTASIKIELLELCGYLPEELYFSLEAARKARNNWAHSLRHPTSKQTHNALNALQMLVRNFLGIDLKLQLTVGEGSFPQWPTSALIHP